MNKLISLLVLVSVSATASDNEIFVDQVGATANIDLEQLGSGNIIGGLTAVAGSMTALDLDGTSMTLDINQIGDTNKFLGDMYADTYTGYFNFDGDTNSAFRIIMSLSRKREHAYIILFEEMDNAA